MDSKLFDERFNYHQRQLDEHEKRIEDLEKTYAIMQKMEWRVGNIEDSISKINNKLDSNQQEKGKKWDKLIDYIFYFFIGLVLSYVAIKLGVD